MSRENHIVLGIMAHADAGKTTLTEAILYQTGAIRKIGRVDHRDCFLDHDEMERSRGITIFSKQARFSVEGLGEQGGVTHCCTLVDTPGHVDFTPELERAMSVMDAAVLVISGTDGVQGHTENIWRLLEHYEIPAILFINKMDRDTVGREQLLAQMKRRLSDRIMDFSEASVEMQTGDALKAENEQECFRKAWKPVLTDDFVEGLAELDDSWMEHYLEEDYSADDWRQALVQGVAERKIYPCFWGSALQNEGVDRLLQGMAWLLPESGEMKAISGCPLSQRPFAGRVYKILHDEQGERLTFFKVTAGTLKVKDIVKYGGATVGAMAAESGIRETGAYRWKADAEGSGTSYRGKEKATELKGTAGKSALADASQNRTANEPVAEFQRAEENRKAEKVNQLRLYHGNKYETVTAVYPGMLCAATGLTETWPGDGLGEDRSCCIYDTEPVLTAAVLLNGKSGESGKEKVGAETRGSSGLVNAKTGECGKERGSAGTDKAKGKEKSSAGGKGTAASLDEKTILRQFRILEEEEPALQVSWDDQLKEIQVHIMGPIQLEILKHQFESRFGVSLEFGPCRILYKETISQPVIGSGHYEPLRHYAEAHLRMEPLPAGEGIRTASVCSRDVLDINYQKLALSHVTEREHRGVLTGAPVTDIRFTLLTGRSHLKHTEGGDFREAVYRGIRHGLMQARERGWAVLLEPWYDFVLTVPADMIGRAMSDIQMLNGEFEPFEMEDDMAIVKGNGPAATLMDYPLEVAAYTKGRGSIRFHLSGYRPCHNAEEVIEANGYQPELDLANPAGSVFCSHGAGYVVPWREAAEKMHCSLE